MIRLWGGIGLPTVSVAGVVWDWLPTRVSCGRGVGLASHQCQLRAYHNDACVVVMNPLRVCVRAAGKARATWT